MASPDEQTLGVQVVVRDVKLVAESERHLGGGQLNLVGVLLLYAIAH